MPRKGGWVPHGCPSTLRLPDGRMLAWHEFGDPAGTPCLYLPGTPSSGLAGRAYHRPAANARVRLISVDRPGYGGSDFAPRRRLIDTATDIAHLVDHLNLPAFAVIGESGGAPPALAVAAGLGKRVVAVAIIAGIGPIDRAGIAAMRPENRRLIRIARTAPWLLRPAFAVTRRQLRDPLRAQRYLKTSLANAPAADQAAIASDPERVTIALEATIDALRHGSRGVAQELRMFTRPWGVDLGQIRAPVAVWHGQEDANVPVAIAEQTAAAIPRCQTTLLPNAGHAIGAVASNNVFEFLASVRTAHVGATDLGTGS